jgi:hypothetical protein
VSYSLEVDTEAGPRRIRLRGAPMFVGRGAFNDIVVTDPSVSDRHLRIWTDESGVFVEDLATTNGTRVNGRSVEGRTRLLPSDEIRLGTGTTLFLRVSEGEGELAFPVVEDLATGLRFAMTRDRFTIGSAAASDLCLAGTDPRTATLLVTTGGEVWLGIDNDTSELTPDAVFEVGGHRFALRLPKEGSIRTVQFEPTESRYRLEATLVGPRGPWAKIIDPSTGRACEIDADNRATLLFVLGQKRKAELDQVDPGWCADDDLALAIWGRGQVEDPKNSLRVLICRVRGDIQKAGLDPWMLEKRRGYVRVRVGDVAIG